MQLQMLWRHSQTRRSRELSGRLAEVFIATRDAVLWVAIASGMLKAPLPRPSYLEDAADSARSPEAAPRPRGLTGEALEAELIGWKLDFPDRVTTDLVLN